MELLKIICQNVGIVELISFISGIIFFVAKLDSNSRANAEMLNTEIKHVTEIIELNHQNLKEDIIRLEKKQEESNKIKERLATQEVLMNELQATVHDHLNNSKVHK